MKKQSAIWKPWEAGPWSHIPAFVERTMPVKTRIRITIETERVLFIDRARSTFDGWCPMCNRLVKLLRADEAAGITAYLRASQCPLEMSKLHIIPTADGLTSVCLNSLLSHGGIGTERG